MSTDKPVRVILLEDIRSDADIIQRELSKADFKSEVSWVQSAEKYKLALREFNPDIIISDHSLRGFKSVDAFQWLRESGLDIPFILVTATISEEFAVMMMREGVADYLLKDRLQRLPLAVLNALKKWQSEREKKMSIEMLMQNEQRFRALIENSHDMTCVTDEHFRSVFASPSFERQTGRTVSDQKEGAGLDNIHPDDRSEYYVILNRAIATPRKYIPLQYRMLHKNGKYIWVEGTVINMLNDEAIHGMLFNLRDITERKEAEELLRRSKANLTAIIENSNVSIYSIDRQFKYISFNSFVKNSLKQIYDLDVKVGDPVFEFLARFDPSELEMWKKVYTDAFSGNRVEFEKEFSVGDYYACLNFSINPIVEDHYVTGLACFAWDITEQRLAARKVSQSEARFRALIENNYDAIVMRDAKGKVLYASPSVKRMLGYFLGDVADGTAQIVHHDDLVTIQQTYTRLLSEPGVPFPVSMRIRKADGTYMWTEGTITNMLDNEEVKGIVSNFRDITERKESELQRERMTLDLVERNKDLEQYAYIVSHNLRGPVANILGISNVIEMAGASSKDKEDALSHLFSSTRNLDEVITDLNQILQLQQNIHEQKEDIVFQELIDEVQSSMDGLLKKNEVEISVDFKVKKIATVKSYLYSIFYNLITNSIKYKKDKVRPVIKITSDVAGEKIRLRFVDNGIGIDLDIHGPKIFGLYKRFHPDHAEGKGMGLFMTKTQVESIGGKISVKSQVNIGTEFIIEL